MRLIRIPALVVSALLLASGPNAVLAAKSKVIAVHFDKCFVAPPPPEDPPPLCPDPSTPLFTFSGEASGDVVGSVEALGRMVIHNDELNDTYLEAEYVLTNLEGTRLVARVRGIVDDDTGLASLSGNIVEGPADLVFAPVRVEFQNYQRADGTPCSKGTLYITAPPKHGSKKRH